MTILRGKPRGKIARCQALILFQIPYIVGHPVVLAPHLEAQYLARNLLPRPPGIAEARKAFGRDSGKQISTGGACSSEDESTWLRTTVPRVQIPPRPGPKQKGRPFTMIEVADVRNSAGPGIVMSIIHKEDSNGAYTKFQESELAGTRVLSV